MRNHAGAYRLLPSPSHVVLMRFTGEDGRVDAGDGAIVRLAGEIVAPGVICDMFALLAQTGWRGILTIHSGTILRQIYMDQGNVLGVRSNEPEERLGRVMYRYGHLNLPDLEALEAQVQAGRRFGEAAIESGILQKEKLYQAFRQQVIEVVVGAMHVSDGTFFFLDGLEESELPARLAVSLNGLLMDGVTRLDEMRYFEEKVPSVEHVPVRQQMSEAPPEAYLPVLELVDGVASVREIGRRTGLGEFETTKKLYALVQSKHVAIHPPPMSGGIAGIAAAANDVLHASFRAAKDAGVGAELKTSLEQFTVGAGVFYDMLFRGAGPDGTGRLDPERIAANAELVAQGGDEEQQVRKLLFEYVSFALFSVGATLGKERETQLSKECDLALQALRPNG